MHWNHQTLIKNRADMAQVKGLIIRCSPILQLLPFALARQNVPTICGIKKLHTRNDARQRHVSQKSIEQI